MVVGVTEMNGLLLKKMMIAGANELNANKQLVDSLNVFPVPDGDTGTNMSLTALAAARECEKSDSLSVGEIAKLASNGALRGARGNSGVITSQIFRGFAKGLEGMEKAGVTELVYAAEQGVKTAYKAVMKPKEGTILTVARACAESSQKRALETNDIEEFLRGILADAHEVLLQTTDMIPVLKQAGVVDAGGKGLLCILEGACNHVNTEGQLSVDEPLKTKAPTFTALASVKNEGIVFGYCTEFFINIKNSQETVVQNLKNYLSTIGDSVVCVNDEEIIKIHVHTDHPGLAIERALSLGSLSGLKIDNMREQHHNNINFDVTEKQTSIMSQEVTKKIPKEKWKEVGVVSISVGSGLSEIFRSLGVDAIIEGGQTMNPSTEDILNAVETIAAKHIIVLPNNKNIILAAEQAAKLSKEKQLHVVPSTTIPEGISAMFQYRATGNPLEMTETMTEAMATVKTATVTYAVRKTSIDGKEIQEGDILGMLGGAIAVVGKSVTQTTKDLLKEMITDEIEIVGIYYGSDIVEEQGKELVDFMKETYPACEVELKKGDQPLYYYIISAE